MTAAVPGLSCYTANLRAYLDDASARIAASVRLAVRNSAGPLLFSHHRPALDRLPDGSRLAYAGADTAAGARSALAAELDRWSRVLVLVDHARLPWSATYGGRPAPHWLLLDARRAGEWHAVDEFRATLPDGAEQNAYGGPIGTADLTDAMAVSPVWTPAQRRRTAMAFGVPVKVPPTAYVWLRRVPAGSCEPDLRPRLGGGGPWATGGAALALLADRLTVPGTGLDDHLDDLWAAAGHHCFAYGHRLALAPPEPVREQLAACVAAWARLPSLLRIAAGSAARGRPRPALVRAGLTELRSVHDGLSMLDSQREVAR